MQWILFFHEKCNEMILKYVKESYCRHALLVVTIGYSVNIDFCQTDGSIVLSPMQLISASMTATDKPPGSSDESTGSAR